MPRKSIKALEERITELNRINDVLQKRFDLLLPIVEFAHNSAGSKFVMHGGTVESMANWIERTVKPMGYEFIKKKG